MNTSQVKAQARSTAASAQAQQQAARAALAAMRTKRGLDLAIAAARYATLSFEADKAAKQAGFFAGAATLMEQAEGYSRAGRADLAKGTMAVAAANLGMAGVVRRLSSEAPEFVSAAMVQQRLTPVSGSSSSFVRDAARSTESLVTTGKEVVAMFGGFEEFPGYGDVEMDTQPVEEITALNSAEQGEQAFTRPLDVSDVPDGTLSTDDGAHSLDLKDPRIKQGLSAIQQGAKSVKDADPSGQVAIFQGRGDALAGTLRESWQDAKELDVIGLGGDALKLYAQGSAVVLGATAAGAGIATALVSAGVLSAAVPAGTIIAGAIVLAVGVYVLYDLITEESPPGPSIIQTGRLPAWLTNGDPAVAAAIFNRQKAVATRQGPLKGPESLQEGFLRDAAKGPSLLPPKPMSPFAPAIAGAGAGFLLGGPVGAGAGGVLGWLWGKR